MGNFIYIAAADLVPEIKHDEERDDGEPEDGHQDRARVEEMAVEDLDEKERRHAEVDREGHEQRQDLGCCGFCL